MVEGESDHLRKCGVGLVLGVGIEEGLEDRQWRLEEGV